MQLSLFFALFVDFLPKSILGSTEDIFYVKLGIELSPGEERGRFVPYGTPGSV